MPHQTDVDQLAINTMRMLAVDAVQAAALDTPNMAGPRAWRAPPVRSARARRPADRTQFAPAAGLAKGAYVLADATGGKPDVILIASGSKVSLCLAAREQLGAEDVATRVVSMPAWELFEEQDAAYCDSVMLPAVTARVTVEEGSTLGWQRYAGSAGAGLGMHTFGMSAPIKVVAEHFGFTADRVAAAAKQAMARGQA